MHLGTGFPFVLGLPPGNVYSHGAFIEYDAAACVNSFDIWRAREERKIETTERGGTEGFRRRRKANRRVVGVERVVGVRCPSVTSDYDERKKSFWIFLPRTTRTVACGAVRCGFVKKKADSHQVCLMENDELHEE